MSFDAELKKALDEEGVNDLTPDETAIIEWWLAQEAATLAMAIRKRRQYGSRDLGLMGDAMDMISGDTGGGGFEKAIAFYALGKVSRIFGAWERGEDVVDDSWVDLGVYSKMALYARDTGGW